MYTIEQLKSFIETTDYNHYCNLAHELAKQLLEQRELASDVPTVSSLS
jgi:hypothetical protein